MSDNLVKSLVIVSEKAANIARVCRQDEHLFSMLIQEKSIDESNPRFVQDFKTLADVLIQEVLRHDIGNMYPDLLTNIKGEETSMFTNKLGESVVLQTFDDPAQTSECLLKVLNNDKVAADTLSAEVHRTISIDLDDFPELPEEMNYSNMGIWVDPIDATGEYIKGVTRTNYPNIPASGLGCVTVLIGVYDIETKRPIIGVINQPFYEQDESGYKSKIVWGIDFGDLHVTNLPVYELKTTKLAMISPSEDEKYIKALKDLGYQTVFSAGAGHKILKVITGDADLYLLSKNTTFKWDTCGPHAILNAIGGGLFKIEDIIESGNVVEIEYDVNDPMLLNNGGLLALRKDEKHILQDLYRKK